MYVNDRVQVVKGAKVIEPDGANSPTPPQLTERPNQPVGGTIGLTVTVADCNSCSTVGIAGLKLNEEGLLMVILIVAGVV